MLILTDVDLKDTILRDAMVIRCSRVGLSRLFYVLNLHFCSFN